MEEAGLDFGGCDCCGDAVASFFVAAYEGYAVVFAVQVVGQVDAHAGLRAVGVSETWGLGGNVVVDVLLRLSRWRLSGR